MTRRAAALLVVVGAAVAGCGALDPYPTVPRPLSPAVAPGIAVGAPTIPRVAICYNTLTTTLAEVQVAAREECGANTVAKPADTDWYLQNCPLLLPARATFVCTAKK